MAEKKTPNGLVIGLIVKPDKKKGENPPKNPEGGKQPDQKGNEGDKTQN